MPSRYVIKICDEGVKQKWSIKVNDKDISDKDMQQRYARKICHMQQRYAIKISDKDMQ